MADAGAAVDTQASESGNPSISLSSKTFGSSQQLVQRAFSKESCRSDSSQEEPTSGPISRKSVARSPSNSVGLTTPTSVHRTASRKSGHRTLRSAKSGITQFFNESESMFTTGISFDIAAVKGTEAMDFLNPSVAINELYGVDNGYVPKSMDNEITRLTAYAYEDHMSAEVIDDICGIHLYKQACLQRDVHPSAIVIAAIRRNPVHLNLENIYLGPLGAQCLAAAIHGQLSKSMETLSLKNCKIGPNGLCSIIQSLLDLPDECMTDINYAIPEDEEADHRHSLTALNLEGNGLAAPSELLADGTGLPPLVTPDQLTYSSSEYNRIKELQRKEGERCREKIDLSIKVMTEQERKAKEAALQKEKNAKKNEIVDPYLEMIRATALYNFGSSEPRPFVPPKKLTEEEVKKMKAAGQDVSEVPPDPTFFDKVQFHRKLSTLHIITASQLVNVIKHMLNGLSLLTHLDLSSNGLNDSFFKGASKYLCAHASLAELIVANNQITETGLQALITELPNSINLERIDMSSNQFGSIGACILAYGLCKVMARTSLRLCSLCLNGNKIGDEAGAFVLGCFMGGCVIPEIMKYGTDVAKDFMGTLPAPISPIWRAGPIKHVSGIVTLELADCGLGISSCLQLCKILISGTVKIKNLDLSKNALNNGPGFYSIVKALVQRKKSCSGEDCHIEKFSISNKLVQMDEVRQFIDTGEEDEVVEFSQLAGELAAMNGDYIGALTILPY